jgi:UDP-glucose 4-epimerase
VITGSESEIVLVPYEEAYGEGFEDMYRRVPDISKIERKLGWGPTASLDEILRDVVGYEMSLNPLSPYGASLAGP